MASECLPREVCTTVRKMAGGEQFMAWLHDEHGGICNVGFIARFEGPVLEAEIRSALTAVTRSCDRLAWTYRRNRSGEFEFVRRTPAPEVRIETVTVDDADECGTIVPARLRQPFDALNGPLLRWLVLIPRSGSEFQIAALAHHCLVDGMSIFILLRRFLEAYGSESVPAWEWPERELPSPRWSTFAANMHSELTVFRRHRARRRRAHPVLPREETGSGVSVFARWTAAETARLIQACREARTTVTGALAIAGSLAVHERYPAVGSVIDLNLPVDLRRYLPAEEAPNVVGVVIAMQTFAIRFDEGEDFAWQAREISRLAQTWIGQEGPLRMTRLVDQWMPRLLKAMKKLPAAACVSANSLGRIDWPSNAIGVRPVEAGWFVAGAECVATLSQTAATIGDRLCVTYFSARLSAESVRDLAARSTAHLRAFAKLPAE